MKVQGNSVPLWGLGQGPKEKNDGRNEENQRRGGKGAALSAVRLKWALFWAAGTGDYAEALEDAVKLPYSEIPGFPRPTVAGHAGMWCCGTLHGKRVVMMQGRFHYYEGYSMKDVTLPVRVMQEIGVKTLIVTNAAGGVNLGCRPGDLMVIGDMFSLTAQNPLIGPDLSTSSDRAPRI